MNDASPTTAWITYHNVVNPHPGSWEALIPAITKHFDDKVKPVTFQSWFEALKATASKTNDVAKNPGIKLLEFFEQMGNAGGEVVLETQQTVSKSPALGDLRAVGPEWMEIWLNQWDF